MRKMVLFLAAIGNLLFAAEASAPNPNLALKLRALPIVTGISSSVNAERFNHSVFIDAEYFFLPHFSVLISAGHSRLSVGRAQFDSNGNYTDIYIQEGQLGLLLTYFLKSDLNQGSLYVRAHGFSLFLNTDNSGTTSGAASSTGQDPINLANTNSAFRVGLEAGYVILAQGNLIVDFGGGFSTYLNNPYNQFTSNNRYGVPATFTNVFFGLSNVYPTVNASVGYYF